ncbi:MAG: hypothetical protein ICV66_04105 [Chitinophagaceae bacterium]|nr:hypothetical protein [Chitinophagaceae bacterium]
MKKILLFTIFYFLIISVTSAQITKGSVLIGSSIYVSSYEIEDGTTNTKQTFFAVSPSIGRAIVENMIIGVRLSYGHGENKYSSAPSQEEITTYSAGLFLRNYFLLGRRFYLFGVTDAGFGRTERHQTSGIDYERNLKDFSIGSSFSPAISYAVNRRFHLEAGLNSLLNISYTTTKITTVSFTGVRRSKAHGFSLYANLSNPTPLTIGFQLLLTK